MPLLWQCNSLQQSQYRSCVQLLLTLQHLALHCPCLPPATQNRCYLHSLPSPAEEGAEARSALCSHVLFSVLWNTCCFSEQTGVFSRESVCSRRGEDDKTRCCGTGEPKELNIEEISALWKPAHFAASTVGSSFEEEVLVPPWDQSDCSGTALTICAKDLVRLKHLWLHGTYLVLALLKDSKSITHHYYRKNVYEGITENGLLLFPTDLCHIYLLKVKKACYFISFYMSVPNIVFVQIRKTESVKPATSTCSAQLRRTHILVNCSYTDFCNPG